ncbi:TetR/AcrR family transcriptional regulator [Actinomadura atramentaria]|uniref:TetR/AcrR family transcriptional regulator n=1 Tax=Actinomadura atramentaria TaxID=1990 RepID=UPI00036D99DE|nr:TetR/AcrR family transcriptional regulator [Actinomadura atramentaria]
MPTGVALRDAREQLFAAAERVLLRDGPNALTSRAVAAEAGVAKGVVHRHFTDFDAFLADLVTDRAARVAARGDELAARAGAGDVPGNVAAVLAEVFGPVALSVVALTASRDGLRARLRAARPFGVPVLAEAAEVIAGYLAAERDAGRIAADTDVDVLALTLVGAAHLLYAGRDDRPGDAEVRRIAAASLAPALT